MNRKLGFVVATFISLATLPAMAQDSEGGQGQGQRFEQIKSRILQHLKDREACIGAAQNLRDLRGCKQDRQGSPDSSQNAGQEDEGDDGSGSNGSSN